MRCSALPLVSKCRGSYSLTRKQIGQESEPGLMVRVHSHGSIMSRLGTAFHELARAKVKNLPDNMPEVRVKYGLTEEEEAELQQGLNNVTFNIPEGAIVYADDKQLSALNGKLVGTPDLGIFQIKEFTLTVADHKSGWGDVEPPQSNNQLIGYAIMLCLYLESQGYTIKTVNIHIIQPKLKQVKSATFTRDEIRERAIDIERIIDEAEKPGAELTTGPWCNACFKCFNCPAFAGEIRTLMSLLDKGELQGDIQKVLSHALPFAKACGTVKNKIEALAKAYVDQNGDLDLGAGQKYSRVIGSKQALNAEKAFKQLEEWFSKEEIWPTLSISADKINAICREKKRGLSTVVSKSLTDNGAVTDEMSISYRIIKTGEEDNNGKKE